MTIKLGLIVNPWAGIGGPAALKGSDGAGIVEQALALGSVPRAAVRAGEFLDGLAAISDRLQVLTCPGDMGQTLCQSKGMRYQVIDLPLGGGRTTALDTVAAARGMAGRVDVLVFVGGDGTARDIYTAVGSSQPCLGVPAGVKMHSGVYGITPMASAEILKKLVRGELVSEQLGEVRDIDEEAFRLGLVKTRFYGELRVPQEGRYLQHVKCGGREDSKLVLIEIAAYLKETMEEDRTYLIGSGRTTLALKQELGLEGTLLGVDVVRNDRVIALDATESQLYEIARQSPCRLVVSPIGGQGHLFGRGNQQLSPRVLNAVGIEAVQVIATREKLKTLEGRPLQVDTGDPALNRKLAGFVSILTGYDDRVLYPVEFNG